MFAKLLKHEWKANSGLLGILSLAVMGVSVLVTVLLRFATADNVHVPDIVMVPVVLLIIGGFLAMLVYSLGVQIIMLARFYKNKFTVINNNIFGKLFYNSCVFRKMWESYC